MPKMKINTDLLPIKGHYFFFNAGTAPLVPYLSTYARQLGFSPGTIGLIYATLPLFGLIAKPLFGVIADKFKKQKSIFILFQILTILSFSSIYFIPENSTPTSIELTCDDSGFAEKCNTTTAGYRSESSICGMDCDMTLPMMWQTVCEHWNIPQYCNSSTDTVQYTSLISPSLGYDKCSYFNPTKLSFHGLHYVPNCRMGSEYVQIDEPCKLNCSYKSLSAALINETVHMVCLDDDIVFRTCSNNTSLISQLERSLIFTHSEISCKLNRSTPWRLMEICEGFEADRSVCYPRTNDGNEFPSNLSFTMHLTTVKSDECDYIELNHIELSDDSVHDATCVSNTRHDVQAALLNSNCKMACDDPKVIEIFEKASMNSKPMEYTRQFWLFFAMMILSWIGQAVVVTFADAICFNLLGSKVSRYGRQRLWGSIGWGIFSLLTGVLIDFFSDENYNDYTIAFILMFVFMSGDVIVSCFVKTDTTKMSLNILADVGTLLSSLPTIIFMLWTISVGLCTGLLWNFLFMLIEDIADLHADSANYKKTLQGLVGAIQTFGGEIPFLFLSGYILKKVGHTNMMSLVLLALGVRFMLYSYVTNPWLLLPIEMFQGITFGMFYPTLTSYASLVSPSGTETTVQGLVGAIFEGVGTSLGNFIGGRLYDIYGGWVTFRIFGIGALICCVVHSAIHGIFKDKVSPVVVPKGYSSVKLCRNGKDAAPAPVNEFCGEH